MMNNEDFAAELLGKIVKSKRALMDMKQNDLAVALGVDQRKISDWESGRTKRIPKQYWAKLFELLDIDPERDLRDTKVNIKLPLISSSEYSQPHVKATIEFAEYVLNNVSNQSAEFGFIRPEADEYALRYEMRELLENFLRQRQERQYRSKE